MKFDLIIIMVINSLFFGREKMMIQERILFSVMMTRLDVWFTVKVLTLFF